MGGKEPGRPGLGVDAGQRASAPDAAAPPRAGGDGVVAALRRWGFRGPVDRRIVEMYAVGQHTKMTTSIECESHRDLTCRLDL